MSMQRRRRLNHQLIKIGVAESQRASAFDSGKGRREAGPYAPFCRWKDHDDDGDGDGVDNNEVHAMRLGSHTSRSIFI